MSSPTILCRLLGLLQLLDHSNCISETRVENPDLSSKAKSFSKYPIRFLESFNLERKLLDVLRIFLNWPLATFQRCSALSFASSNLLVVENPDLSSNANSFSKYPMRFLAICNCERISLEVVSTVLYWPLETFHRCSALSFASSICLLLSFYELHLTLESPKS